MNTSNYGDVLPPNALKKTTTQSSSPRGTSRTWSRSTVHRQRHRHGQVYGSAARQRNASSSTAVWRGPASPLAQDLRRVHRRSAGTRRRRVPRRTTPLPRTAGADVLEGAVGSVTCDPKAKRQPRHHRRAVEQRQGTVHRRLAALQRRPDKLVEADRRRPTGRTPRA